MPTICRSTPFQTTLGIEVAMQLAPRVPVGEIFISEHTLPDYTITIATAVNQGDETISVQLTSPPSGITSVYLDAGTILDFPGTLPADPPIRVKTSAPATVSTTATTVNILPAPAAIGTVAATTKALLFVPGCRLANVAPTIKTEDTTNYLSGTGMEMVVTGNSKKISMELDLVYNNPAHDLILKMAYDNTYVGAEAYIDVIYPSGERHEGYALMTTATPANNVQAKRSMTLEWNIQGGCYDYTAATIPTITGDNITFL